MFVANMAKNYEDSKKGDGTNAEWLDRCFMAQKNDKQMLFPIVQGNFFKDLRLESLEKTLPYAKCGLAIGGLSVGEPKELMYEILDNLKTTLARKNASLFDGCWQP